MVNKVFVIMKEDIGAFEAVEKLSESVLLAMPSLRKDFVVHEFVSSRKVPLKEVNKIIKKEERL